VKKIIALTVAALLALATIAPVMAGSTGYEGQPGNQSSGSGGGNSGYEGQPGNRSGH
jgi:hypothetical protein